MCKISILMGIYNCEDTLPRAIDSVINQTYTEWELILCDDASTDNTYGIAQKYRDRYPEKIILIQNECNMRLAATLNHCLEYATGKYVSRMDGDDEILPERFEKQVEYLEDHPEIDLVGTAVLRINNEKRFLLGSVENPDRFSMRRKPPFHHATILTYKYVYDRLGGYTVAERTRRAEDQDLWFRFYREGFKGDNLKDALYIIYETDANIKRRKFSDRWLTLQVQINGFKMLGYPKRWLIRPLIECLVKSLTPFWAQKTYRAFIHSKSERQIRKEK